MFWIFACLISSIKHVSKQTAILCLPFYIRVKFLTTSNIYDSNWLKSVYPNNYHFFALRPIHKN